MPINSPANMYRIVHGIGGTTEPVFAVVAKRSYTITPGKGLHRIALDTELRSIDEYYDRGDPEWATIKFEAELVPYKSSTDVVVVGKAYAARGIPTETMDVSISVAGHTKAIRVIGDRECRYRPDGLPAFTDPVSFVEMEIRYERAFGGRDEISDPLMPVIYPRNDMGCGLAVKNTKGVIEGLRLPNLEDASDLLTPERVILGDPYRWNSLPIPQGFGWIHRTWYPRCSFFGSMPPYLDPDELMREEDMGLVPKHHVALSRQFKLPSFDVRFNNGASNGLMFPNLKGDEHVQLIGLTPEGKLDFSLPGETPQMTMDIGLGERRLEPYLQTVTICPDEMKVDLIWSGAYAYPSIDWLSQMKCLKAEVS